MQKGKYAESLNHFKMADLLLPAKDSLKQALAIDIKNTEQLRQLDEKLPIILRGEIQPASVAEKLKLASICQQQRRLYATSGRFYTEAFAEQPSLADDLRNGFRYNAACAAALAGCGKGEDAAQLDSKVRATWRKRVLEWLRADLASWSKSVRNAPPQARLATQQILKHWRTDADLAGIREVAELNNLPEQESEAFQRLWRKVGALLKSMSEGN